MNYGNSMDVLAYMQSLDADGWNGWAVDCANNIVAAMTSRFAVSPAFQASLAALPQESVMDAISGMMRCAETLTNGGSLDLYTDMFEGAGVESTRWSVTISWKWVKLNPVITNFKIVHHVND